MNDKSRIKKEPGGSLGTGFLGTPKFTGQGSKSQAIAHLSLFFSMAFLSRVD